MPYDKYDNANEIVNQIDLETLLKESDFTFYSVQLLCYKCCKKNSKCWGSHIDSPNRTKKKKATINTKNEDDNCFQYGTTVASNHEEIKRDSQIGMD